MKILVVISQKIFLVIFQQFSLPKLDEEIVNFYYPRSSSSQLSQYREIMKKYASILMLVTFIATMHQHLTSTRCIPFYHTSAFTLTLFTRAGCPFVCLQQISCSRALLAGNKLRTPAIISFCYDFFSAGRIVLMYILTYICMIFLKAF